MSDMDREELEQAAKAAIELKNRQYAQDPWLWMTEQVRTIDEATQQLRPFPVDKEYLLDSLWVLQNVQKLAVPKSRRMFISWILSLYCLWRARFHPHNAIFWQSEKEDKAAFVIDRRCKFVEDNLHPLYRKPYDSLKTKTGQVGRLTFKETGSYIWGIPQGDSQIRSYTPSILVMDECDFQPEAPQALKAALSTVEKDAQIILITTSNGPGHPVANICRDAGFLRYKP